MPNNVLSLAKQALLPAVFSWPKILNTYPRTGKRVVEEDAQRLQAKEEQWEEQWGAKILLYKVVPTGLIFC
jgi:hypothetical protein